MWTGVVTMKDRHARGPEAPMHDLSEVVSAGSANRSEAARLRQAGMPEDAASEDTGEVAEAKPGVRSRLSDPAAGYTERSTTGTVANAGASE
jgi:hypothetical protein